MLKYNLAMPKEFVYVFCFWICFYSFHCQRIVWWILCISFLHVFQNAKKKIYWSSGKTAELFLSQKIAQATFGIMTKELPSVNKIWFSFLILSVSFFQEIKYLFVVVVRGTKADKDGITPWMLTWPDSKYFLKYYVNTDS